MDRRSCPLPACLMTFLCRRLHRDEMVVHRSSRHWNCCRHKTTRSHRRLKNKYHQRKTAQVLPNPNGTDQATENIVDCLQ